MKMKAIKTERLILRPLKLEDAESMFEYTSDLEMTQFVSWEPHKSLEDSKEFINSVLGEYEAKNSGPYGIFLKTAPYYIIGTIGLRVAGHKFEAELSYALARRYWQQGITYEAASALVDRAFTEHKFKRIMATCAKENIASKRLMKKLGMTYEGCLRARSYRKERFWDLEYYSILDNDVLNR